MGVDTAVSPWLQGILAPVADERDAVDLTVTGELPAGLRGVFMRNGANPAFTPPGRYHIFDGDGMVHALYLDEDSARYRNRWVESRGLAAERRAGRALFGGLSEFKMPDADLMAEVGPMKNTANTHIVSHAGRYFALMEAGDPTELTRDLETLGEHDFDGKLVGGMTAHPKRDPATGELLFFAYSPFPPFLRYHVADAEGRLIHSVEIDLPAAVMMHDFVCTDRSVIFFDLPAIFDVEAMLSGAAGITWQPDRGARIGVLPRNQSGGEVRWFDIEPCYVFHFLNAWEADGVITVDGCRSERLPIAFGDETIDSPVHPMLTRWTIDLAAGVVKTEQLDDQPGDFPRLNDSYAGLANRYGYVGHAADWDKEFVEWDGVIKHDFTTGTTKSVTYGPNEYGGEPVFAPDPDGSAEDDGWLLTFVGDKSSGTSALVVLDAHDLDEVTRVHIPHRIPSGFHGSWAESLR